MQTMIDLALPIEKLRSVGTRNLPRLRKLGIKTVKDLLWHFPVRYEDFSRVVPISEVEPGNKVNIQGEVLKISSRRIFPRRLVITQALVRDDSGAINAVWFNQPYLANSLAEGTFVSLAGKATLNKQGLCLSSPTYEKINELDFEIKKTNLTHTGGMIPVYPETEGISSKYLRFLIKPIIDGLSIDDPLPDEILSKHGFLSLKEALSKIHYPNAFEDIEKAKERLAFNDLILFQLKALLERRKINQLKSVPVEFQREFIQDLIQSLPFELTKDQKIAAWEILKDIQKTYPMNRLLEGDVGSGKTVVALIGAVQAAKAGLQTVFMAPTEVLAQQHYKTATSLLKNQNINIALLTSGGAGLNNKDAKKTDLKKKISQGEVSIVIGTHAVIQKDVAFKNLAMVIIDEQHRFGVSQRAALVKSNGSGLIPHLLSMTATPIPRTLALTIYGDLDISIIKEKPKNRQKIITSVVSPKEVSATYRFIREQVNLGRQVFVICPRIELSAEPQAKSVVLTRGTPQDKSVSQMKWIWADVKAVEEEYKKLSENIFPDLKVGMLHGKMKPAEKNSIMDKFKNKETDILVSTSVVEVGVDVPNATIMMIENAERFGLAQLHQFRGRVGRDQYQSYCLLLSSTPDTEINKRLKILVECNDGFELAEKDMSLRGPGEFFGVKQSGMPDLAMASLANVELIKKARTEARLLLKTDSLLKNYPLLRESLERFQKLTHFE